MPRSWGTTRVPTSATLQDHSLDVSDLAQGSYVEVRVGIAGVNDPRSPLPSVQSLPARPGILPNVYFFEGKMRSHQPPSRSGMRNMQARTYILLQR